MDDGKCWRCGGENGGHAGNCSAAFETISPPDPPYGVTVYCDRISPDCYAVMFREGELERQVGEKFGNRALADYIASMMNVAHAQGRMDAEMNRVWNAAARLPGSLYAAIGPKEPSDG